MRGTIRIPASVHVTLRRIAWQGPVADGPVYSVDLAGFHLGVIEAGHTDPWAWLVGPAGLVPGSADGAAVIGAIHATVQRTR